MGKLDTTSGRLEPSAEQRPRQAAELPPREPKRWVPRLKAQVVNAVRGGALSLDDACRLYALTEEEYLSWERALDRFGLPGLRASHALDYRAAP